MSFMSSTVSLSFSVISFYNKSNKQNKSSKSSAWMEIYKATKAKMEKVKCSVVLKVYT